jgi:phage terminase small subunit
MGKQIVAEIEGQDLSTFFNKDGTLENAKHEMYAQAYVQHFHQQKAIQAIGMSEDDGWLPGIAHRIHKKPEVRQRIKDIVADRVKELAIDENWVVLKLVKVLDRAMQEEEVKDRYGNPTGGFEFDGRNANRALELLGNHLGMFKKQDQSTAGQVVINLDYGQDAQVRIGHEPIEGETD